MAVRGPVCAVVVAVALSGCGSTGSGNLEKSLVVDLPGFVAVAARPTPATLCDPDPTRPDLTPPGLPDELGTPVAVNYESAPVTLEAYAWEAADADEAGSLIDTATTSAAACAWSSPSMRDLDGDGVPETPSTEEQQVEPWSGAGWEGLRILRTVPGTEQTDRRLVRADDVVLLVVVRADGDDPALLTAADDYLSAVGDALG